VSTQIFINGNAALTSLSGLNNLASTGEIYLRNNNVLTNISALSNISTCGSFWIENCDALVSLGNMPLLTQMAQLRIEQNALLANLNGLNLNSIQSSFGSSVYIGYNAVLNSISSLNSVSFFNGNSITIRNNPQLSVCAIPFICTYINNGGVPFITANAAGCNTYLQVQSACPPLPVELLEFWAKPELKTISLYWQTAMELNNNHFILEHSIDGRWFQMIGQLPANPSLKYVFRHQNPSNGINYYRLQQVDIDGTSTYSSIVQANISGDNIVAIPNPTSGMLTLSGTDISDAIIRVRNTTGMVMRTFTIEEEVPFIDLQTLPSGLYFLEIQTKRGAQVIKVRKQ
jgi:hypothetical protein